MTTTQERTTKRKLPAKQAGSANPENIKSAAEISRSNSICTITDGERKQMIATNAYYRAEQRHFMPGEEEKDWLAAEAEINQLLSAASFTGSS